MVEFAPATGGLALWVRHQDLSDGTAGPAVTTDGHTIFYSRAFDALPLTEQTGLVAHEVLHIALRHAQRYLALRRLLGDVDLMLFNICADAVVDSTLAHLSWLRLPRDAVHLDRLLATVLDVHEPVEKSLLEWSVERLYRAVDDRIPKGEGRTSTRSAARGAAGEGRRDAAGGNTVRQDEDGDPAGPTARIDGARAQRTRTLMRTEHVDLIPGPDTEGPPEDAAEQTREWSERLVRGHAGDGGFSMLRALIADLPATRTPWQHLLATRIAHCLAATPAPSWSRPTRSYIANQGRMGSHRRMPWEPGTSPTRPVPRVAVVVDVSGSIEDGLMTQFAREIEAITRRLEATLVLVVGDDQVRRVALFEPGRSDLATIEFQGGGDTDFTPLLEEASRHRPDIVVVLTDLQGPARFRPRCPVVWAVPERHAAAQAPFGRKIVLGTT